MLHLIFKFRKISDQINRKISSTFAAQDQAKALYLLHLSVMLFAKSTVYSYTCPLVRLSACSFINQFT
jgi:hypothetical protein